MSDIDEIRPGDTIQIDGYEYNVVSRRERVSPPEGLMGFSIMSLEFGDPLTHKTISGLDVTSEPFELDVCNGPTHEIDPAEIEVVADE